MKYPWILVLWAMLAEGAMAGDAAVPAPDDAMPPAATAETAPGPEAAPAAAPVPPATTGSSAKSPDSFVPSEEISEDLSVSFPVDI